MSDETIDYGMRPKIAKLEADKAALLDALESLHAAAIEVWTHQPNAVARLRGPLTYSSKAIRKARGEQ